MVPLTTYDDYADILLAKQPDMLPGNPVIWIQTTWEGGKAPDQGGTVYSKHAGHLSE